MRPQSRRRLPKKFDRVRAAVRKSPDLSAYYLVETAYSYSPPDLSVDCLQNAGTSNLPHSKSGRWHRALTHFPDMLSLGLLRPRDRTFTYRSIDGHSARFDRRGPLFDLAGDEMLQIARARAIGGDKVRTDRFHAGTERRRIHRCHGCITQVMDDGLRRAVRKEQADPVVGIDGETLLFCRRHGGQHVRAPRGQHSDRLYASGLDRRKLGGHGVAQIVDAAGDEILERRRRAAIGNMLHIDAEFRIQQHTAEMGCGARTSRAE